MKRAGCLVFAALPVVITAGVYVFTPAHSPDGTSKTSASPSPSRSAAPHAAADAKHAKRRAEREKSEDDQVIADPPAGGRRIPIAERLSDRAEPSRPGVAPWLDPVSPVSAGCRGTPARQARAGWPGRRRRGPRTPRRRASRSAIVVIS